MKGGMSRMSRSSRNQFSQFKRLFPLDGELDSPDSPDSPDSDSPPARISEDQLLLVFRALRYLVDKVRDHRSVESGGRLSIELHTEVMELEKLKEGGRGL